MGFGRSEMQFPWGQDVVMSPTGDFGVLTDTPTCSPATEQRALYVIYTNAIDYANTAVTNALGVATTLRPDDLFNIFFGSSIRRLLGAQRTQAVLNEIQARLVNAFLAIPGVSQTQLPTVTVTVVGKNIVLDEMSLFTTTGQPILIPSQTLTPFGTQS